MTSDFSILHLSAVQEFVQLFMYMVCYTLIENDCAYTKQEEHIENQQEYNSMENVQQNFLSCVELIYNFLHCYA